MADMVERVAEGIAKADGYWGLMAMPKERRSIYIKRARAAIEAMREPTDVMKDANAGRDPFTWELMIDAALTPPDQ